MTRPLRLALLLALLPLPALAERPLTGAEFERLVEGRTLTYGEAGQKPYGVERYHPGRRVTWAWTVHPRGRLGRLAMPVFARMWQGYARQALERIEGVLLA